MIKQTILAAALALSCTHAAFAQVTVSQLVEAPQGFSSLPLGSVVSGGRLSGTTLSGATLTLPTGEIFANVTITKVVTGTGGYVVGGATVSAILPVAGGGGVAAGAGAVAAGSSTAGLAAFVGGIIMFGAAVNSSSAH